jgi:hypothetical protein
MANLCSNETTFTATPEAVKWLHDEVRKIIDESQNYEEHTIKVFNLFACPGDINERTLGSRYVYIYGCDEVDDKLILRYESAWHPPTNMVETATNLLKEKSGDFPVVSEGRYWEEGSGFAGIFICDKDGYRSAETDFDTDYDEDDEDFDFYQDVLDPALADLTID